MLWLPCGGEQYDWFSAKDSPSANGRQYGNPAGSRRDRSLTRVESSRPGLRRLPPRYDTENSTGCAIHTATGLSMFSAGANLMCPATFFAASSSMG